MAGKLRLGIILSLLFCVITSFSVPALAAGEPQFRLDMDSLNLQKGVGSTFVVSLINVQDAQIVSIDGLENFDLISTSQSSSTNIVNNVATYRLDIYYAIMPKTAGQFTLKANIEYNGKNYETNSLQVNVTESADNENGSAPDLFVKTVISHKEAFLGEKIVLTYELYARNNIDSVGFTDYTAIDGVVAKDTPNDRLKSESVYIDGNKYAKYEVKQLTIDPIKSGTVTIPSFNIQVNVIIENNGMGSFPGLPGGMFNTSTPMYLQTEEIELIVKPLPTEGRPNNFSGVVGELSLNSQYSRNELNFGDSLALQVEAYGNCNLDGLKNIFGSGITGFSTYETQKEVSESVQDNQYHVQKVLETIMIPEKNGKIDIPDILISYFNPVAAKYETAKIPGTTINVLGDMPQLNGSNGNQTGITESVMISQVNYTDIHNGLDTIQIQKGWIYVAFIGFGILIVLAVGLLWLISMKKRRKSPLKTIYRQLMKAKDINETYSLFNNMIKQCYGLNLKINPIESVRKSLPDAGLAAQIADIMAYVESSEVHGEKGHIHLKNKIRSVYTTKLRKS